jgi:hypothetical protein
MYSKTMMLGICFVTVIAQSGCSLIQSKWREASANRKSLAASTAKVTPWLANSVTINLTDNPVSLPEVLQVPKVAQLRELTSVVVEAGEANVNQDSYLKDNCVVLVRGNDHWYFLEPSSLLELYVGRIPVRPGDKIFTLPLQASKFVVPSPDRDFEYILIEPGQAPERLEVNEVSKRSLLNLAVDGSPAYWWTATVVTRIEGIEVHHLVLPANFDSSSQLRNSVNVTSLDRLFFQPGDIVEKVNFSQLTTRF